MSKLSLEILPNIKSPEDLAALDKPQLVKLAAEIRRAIINTVSITGGHLAPSLGVVELTIALHSVLKSPHDKLIWDVGHQSYAHKLLTGRLDVFPTLRQWGGISGYPRMSESPHDHFGTGHSSTSISAALGYAKARDLTREKYVVAAVIGDGAMTGGMAFEALNHAGSSKTDLLVVLNDNEMSISRNVGALSNYLTTLRLDPALSKARYDLERLLSRIPGVGGPVSRAAETLKDAVKQVLIPGRLFEELGFTYLGPIDGHDIFRLQQTIKDAIRRGGPVLIHALTSKGKGYSPSEENPKKYHGISPLVQSNDTSLTYSEVFGQNLVELARNNPRIVAITAAMPDGTGLSKFAREYPDRFYDVGIAEQHAVTLAAGLAAGGLKPVVAIYSTFLQRAYDQVLHDVALQRLPVVFAIDRAGIVGEDGPTHHGLFDISYLRHIPGVCIFAPSCREDLESMLTFAMGSQKPTAIRYPRGEAGRCTWRSSWKPFRPGESLILRPGHDAAILAVGPLVFEALEAAESLSKQGIEAAVVDVRSIKPLDETLVVSLARDTRRLITVEENVIAGGFGSLVLEVVSRVGVPVSVTCLGIGDTFVEHGTQIGLRQRYSLDARGIAKAVLQETKTSVVG